MVGIFYCVKKRHLKAYLINLPFGSTGWISCTGDRYRAGFVLRQVVPAAGQLTRAVHRQPQHKYTYQKQRKNRLLGLLREDWILRCPRSSSFWVPRNLSHHMDRQARTGDTVFVKSREMTGRKPNTAVVAGGRRVEDDRNPSTLAPLGFTIFKKCRSSLECLYRCYLFGMVLAA